MGKRPITRWQVAPLHLAITAVIAAVVFAVIYFAWYPGALFAAAGGRALFLLIVFVDVTLGPLITLIIFVPGKKGLKFDLATIAVLQIAALCYGAYVLYVSRPVWIVFVEDRFELVRANQVLEAERARAKPPFDALSVAGPHLAGARLPKNPEEQLRIAITAAAGFDLQTYPEYFVPYDDVRRQVTAHAAPLSRLEALNPGEEASIGRLGAKVDRPEDRIGFLPMRAGKRDLAALVDRSNGDFLGTFAFRPWTY